MKTKSIVSVFIVVLLLVKVKMWLDIRMWINPETTCAVCCKDHHIGNDGTEPKNFPTSAEILDASYEYWWNGDMCGFNSYVADLYRGNGTNYLPVIALSGWNDRALLADFESASDKFSRLHNHAIESAKKLPKAHEGFFLRDGLDEQIGLLKRDIYKDRTPSLRLIRKGGYRVGIREFSRRLSPDYFEEMQRFLRDAPPVFIMNATVPAASVQNSNPISTIRHKANLEIIIKINAALNILLSGILVFWLAAKVWKWRETRKSNATGRRGNAPKPKSKLKTAVISLLVLLVALVIVDFKNNVKNHRRIRATKAAALEERARRYRPHIDDAEWKILPTAAEIIDDANEFSRNKDDGGFRLYVASLYRGNGTNYLPVIALSAWCDRALCADNETAKEKLSRLRDISAANLISGSNDLMYFRNDLRFQEVMLDRNLLADKPRNPRSLTRYGFREIENFLRYAPPIFTTNKTETTK